MSISRIGHQYQYGVLSYYLTPPPRPDSQTTPASAIRQLPDELGSFIQRPDIEDEFRFSLDRATLRSGVITYLPSTKLNDLWPFIGPIKRSLHLHFFFRILEGAFRPESSRILLHHINLTLGPNSILRMKDDDSPQQAILCLRQANGNSFQDSDPLIRTISLRGYGSPTSILALPPLKSNDLGLEYMFIPAAISISL
ncbi:uncharacterized protein BT62DRAFT_763922 [Guyanagaster necrorhizus]|uniref:Uncharacterized protein n=1 Tax=Guyanagaster necrorhizus TaxID=856835 RepID=A0A9P7VX20_9AGAR|nr:uncharacterized protein BT62DRAFT_763922 [Guyanagaster necrorhizus MCA 3950]KAG7448300.1 hypothetical protein BT62DRAFT_763922 [Guyanagaster necrorhizus MCA 3950]